MRRSFVFLLLCSIARSAVIDLNQLNLPRILKEHNLGKVDLNQLDLAQILKQLDSPSGSAGKAKGGSAIDSINVIAGIKDIKYVCDEWCPKVKKLVRSADHNVDYWVTLKETMKTYNRNNFKEVCSTCQKHKIQVPTR